MCTRGKLCENFDNLCFQINSCANRCSNVASTKISSLSGCDYFDMSENNVIIIDDDSDDEPDRIDLTLTSTVKEFFTVFKENGDLVCHNNDNEDNNNNDASQCESELATLQFDGKGVREGRRSYYRSVTLDGNLTVNVGDHVIINGDTATDSRLQLHVGVIAKIYDETGAGGGQAHVQWFGRRSDTVLGGTGDPTELFRLRVCEDVPLLSIWRKCTVICVTQQSQDTWRLAGGTVPEDAMKDDGVSFWYRFEYIPVWARFQYPVPWPECPEDRVQDCNFCGVCSSKQVEGNRY